MIIPISCQEFIHGKIIQPGDQTPKGDYLNVAESLNFKTELTGKAIRAVFIGKVDRSIEFYSAFALGQAIIQSDEWIVFTRFLWNEHSSDRGVILHQHHLLLTQQQFFQELGGNFRPLARFFSQEYKNDVMPTFTHFKALSRQIKVEVLPESERLAILWSHLKPVIDPNLVHSLLLALFYDSKVSISHFPRTKNPRADEKLALDMTELMTLLLPLPWRPQLTFATQLFEPDRSPVRLRFDIGRDDRIRVNWKEGEVSYVSPKEKITERLRYADEVVSLLEQNLFDELAELIKQIKISPLLRRDGSSEKELYKAWQPLAEKFFLAQRIEQNRVTLSRWLILLKSGDLDSQQKAIGLAKLTRSMLRDQKGKLKKIWRVVPNYISQADLSVYQEQVGPALEQAPQSAKGLFEVWLQEPAFRAQPACLELSRDLVGHLAKEDWQQASNFIASVWGIFPTTFPVSRTDLIEACTTHISTALDIKRFILHLWKLEGLRQAELAVLLKVPSLNQLPPTRQVITLLAGQSAIGMPPNSLLYDAYEQNWNTSRVLFLFGVLKLALELEQQDFLQRFLWNEELIELAKWVVEPDKFISHYNDPKKRETIESNRKSIKKKASTYRALLEQLLDLVAKELEALATDTRRLYGRLACVLGHFHYLTTSLIANLPSGGVTGEWLSDLKLLSEQQQDALQTQAQVQRIIEHTNWSKCGFQIQFDNDLSIARALGWERVAAEPAIVEAIQLLQNGSELTLPDKDSLLPLLDWLLKRDYHNTPVRKQLLLGACRVALREPTVSNEPITWQDVSQRFFRSPVEENNQWLQENLNVLSVLGLKEQTTLLRELDKQRPDSFSSQVHDILNNAINLLHANWFLEHLLASAHQELPFILLPPLRQEASSEPFVRKISPTSLKQASSAVKLLLEWESSGRIKESKQKEVLNWVAKSDKGLSFLTNLVGYANQDKFMADTVSLIKRLNDTKARQQILAACTKNLKQVSHVKKFILAVVEWPRLTDTDFGTLQFNLQTWGHAHHSGIPLSNSLALPSTSLLFGELSEKRALMNGGLLVSSWEEIDREPAYLFDMLRHLFSVGYEMVVDGQVVKALGECETNNPQDFRPLATKHLAGVLAPLTSLQRFKSLNQQFNQQAYYTLDFSARYAPSLYPRLIDCYLTLYEWDQHVSKTLENYSQYNGQNTLSELLGQLVTQGPRNSLDLVQEVRYYYTLAFQAANDFQRLAPANIVIPEHRQDAQNRFSELLKQHPEMRTQYRISVSWLIRYQSPSPVLWAIAFADELHKVWSWKDKEKTYKFNALIDNVAQYIYRSLNVVPITCLGKQLETLSPNELYILLQSCFSLWQKLKGLLKEEEAEASEKGLLSKLSGTVVNVFKGNREQVSQEAPSAPPDLTNTYGELRTVWMNLIVQLRIQRKELPEAWPLEQETSSTYYFDVANDIFKQASQAYRTVFQEPNDFDEFALLALELAFQHLEGEILWQKVIKLRDDYKELLNSETRINIGFGKTDNSKMKFLSLLKATTLKLLKERSIALNSLDHQIIGNKVPNEIKSAVTEGRNYWVVEEFAKFLNEYGSLISQIESPDLKDEKLLGHMFSVINNLQEKKKYKVVSTINVFNKLSHSSITPLVKDQRFKELLSDQPINIP